MEKDNALKPIATNELDMEVLGNSIIDPFVAHNSASRVAMRSTHIGQAPTPVNGEQRRIFTGGEFRYAEYTFDVSFPVDAHILKIIRKYLPTHLKGGAKDNPRLFALYEPVNANEKVIDVLEVPTYISHHKDFGYRLTFDDEVVERLKPGGMIRAGEKIAGSPAVMNLVGYGYGVNANVVSISDPSTTEDGIVVRRGFLEKFVFKGYHKVSANCGRKYIPINLYGTPTRYQPFPNIGEHTREDGLIFALREIDDTTSAVEMTPEALCKVNYLTDKLVYGEKNARVVDMTVYHDERLADGGCPDGIAEQMQTYYEAGKRFHNDVLSTYEQLRKRHGKSLKIGNNFERLVIDALKYLPAEGKDHVHRKFRLDDLDEWRVDIQYEYDILPHLGYKLTDLFGGKGVNCKIVDDDKMYCDEFGNVVDIAIANSSTIKRTNLGRYFEQFFNAVRRDNVQRMRRMVGLHHRLVNVTQDELDYAAFEHPNRDDALNRLIEMYDNISILNAQFIRSLPYEEQLEHLRIVLVNDAYIHMPPSSQLTAYQAARNVIGTPLEPHRGPLSFINAKGQKRVTKANMLTGDMYIVLLEKMPTGWAATASPRYQHLGIPSKLNNSDKHGAYGREQVVRTAGESEVRAWLAFMGPYFTTNLMDISNNPDTHRHVIHNLITSDDPGAIEEIVDRNKIPLGNARPVKFTDNIINCAGIKFTHRR